MISLQTLPVEILCQIFKHLDYNTVELFLEIHHTYLSSDLAARIVLANSHVFITNFLTDDFQNSVKPLLHIEDIAKMIHNDVQTNPNQILHVSSTVHQFMQHPKILTLYLAFPESNLKGKSSFTSLLTEFTEIFMNGNLSLDNVEKVNIFVSTGCSCCSETGIWRDRYFYEQLKEFESNCMSLAAMKLKLSRLSLSFNGIEWESMQPFTNLIPSFTDFYEFPSLTHLSLTHNENTNLTLSKYQLPKSLIALNLSYSKSLSTEFFQFSLYPPLLEFLDVSGTELGGIMEAQAAPLILPESLKCLILSNNRIKTLQKMVLPKHLKNLDVSGNELITISNVSFPDSLINLNFDGNYIELLAHCKLPSKLERISLASNHIQDCLSSDGSPLVHFPSSLLYLDLSVNKIKSTSTFVFPDGLEELDISYNSIEVLEESSSTFLDLIMLNLSGNPLRSLDLFVCTNESHADCDHQAPKLTALFLNDIDLVAVLGESLKKKSKNRVDFPDSLKFLNMRNTGILEREFGIGFGPKIKVLNMS